MGVSNSINNEEWKNIPITTSNMGIDKNSLVILIQFLFGAFFIIIWNMGYIGGMINNRDSMIDWILFFLILPPFIFANIYLFVFVITLFSAAIIAVLKKIHPIKEGIFDLNSLEGQEEFKYYKLRYWYTYFAMWLARGIPLPWIDFVVLKAFGCKMGSNVCLYDSWLDIELVDIGDHVMTSLNTIILSHTIYHNKFIQLRTILKDNSITGGLSVVAPGTILEEGAILGANCSTYIGQVLEKNLIHLGNPAKKAIPIKFGSTPQKKQGVKKKMNKEMSKEIIEENKDKKNEKKEKISENNQK
ncbi:MAG: hypothetical protein GY870_19790 [archaeon]|nr:hypothetical protein [archaeon]